jgi:hypothetical protein
MIFTRMPQPLAPGDADVLHLLRAHEVGRQRIAEQVGDGHLRVAVLHGAADLAHRIAGENAHEQGAGGLAAARAADEQTFPPRGEGQQRQQDVTRIALRGRQREPALAVAEDVKSPGTLIVLDIVVRADDRAVDDPEVRLAQFLVERRGSGGVCRRAPLGQRAAVEVGDVESPRPAPRDLDWWVPARAAGRR